jgi:hypothetical protein
MADIRMLTPVAKIDRKLSLANLVPVVDLILLKPIPSTKLLGIVLEWLLPVGMVLLTNVPHRAVLKTMVELVGSFESLYDEQPESLPTNDEPA